MLAPMFFNFSILHEFLQLVVHSNIISHHPDTQLTLPTHYLLFQNGHKSDLRYGGSMLLNFSGLDKFLQFLLHSNIIFHHPGTQLNSPTH